MEIYQRFSAIVLVPLYRPDGLHFLATTRPEDRTKWCVPGGKVNDGEAGNVAAARELYEETGVSVVPNMLTPVYTAIDRWGYFCTAFITPRMEKELAQTKLKPEEGAQVDWVPARKFLDPVVTPFCGYYHGLFEEIGLSTLLYQCPDRKDLMAEVSAYPRNSFEAESRQTKAELPSSGKAIAAV